MLRRRLLRERFLFTQAAPASAIFILIVPRPPITHALNRSQLHKNASLPTNTARWSALMREPNQIISYDLCSRPTDSLGKRPCMRPSRNNCARSEQRLGKKMVFYGRKVMFVAHLRGWWVFILSSTLWKTTEGGIPVKPWTILFAAASCISGARRIENNFSWWFERAGWKTNYSQLITFLCMDFEHLGHFNIAFWTHILQRKFL